MRRLRAYSTRATITPTRFQNVYHWGDFKGDPKGWVEKFFDGYVHFANWGTRKFALRLTSGAISVKVARRYACGEAAWVDSGRGRPLVLWFVSEDEDGDDCETGEEYLDALLVIRRELSRGDLRALYLAWLLNVQHYEVEDDETEPPVPAGLGQLSEPQQALVEFLRIDADLIRVAARTSPRASQRKSPTKKGIRAALKGWSLKDKDSLLVKLASGEDAERLRQEILSRVEARSGGQETAPESSAKGSRTAAELRETAERISSRRSRCAKGR